MMKAPHRVFLLGSAALGALAIGSAGHAQDAHADAGETATIEEVVVTAQRRSESLQKAPVAVTALSPEVMQQRNINTTQDLMQVTPSLQVSTQTASGGGSATFFLRGMGQQRSGNGSEPAVGIYVDDLYYPSLLGSVFNILDLQQVEVLRGPQGTLFGRNTIGGAIRYTSKKPSFEFGGFVQGVAGSYDRRDLTGSLNVPIGEVAAVRLTAGSLDTDGYVRQQNGGKRAAGAETTLVRGQLRIVPTDTLQIDVSAQSSRFHLDGFSYRLPGPISPLAGTLPAAWNASPAGQANPYDNRYVSQCDFCQAGSSDREYSKTNFDNANVVVQWDVAEGLTLKSLTGWQEVANTSFSDLDGTPLPIFQAYGSSITGAMSQEFQINGRHLEGRLNWVGGVYYYDEYTKNRLLPVGQVTLGNPAAQTYSPRKTQSKAAFIDGNWALNDTVTVLAGLRYSKDHKDVELYNAARVLIAAADKSFASTTGRIGVQAQWSPNIMTYASISTGFRGGGFTQANNLLFPFEPENVISYEVGARMDLLDGRVRFNPTAFYTNWKDIQVQSVVPTATGVFVLLQNAAKAHSSGLELEGEAALTNELRVFGNLALLNIEYDGIGAASGITVDSRFQRAPKLTYAIGARWRHQFDNGFTTTATANWSWQGVQYSTPTDADTLRLPSYGLLSARLDVSTPDGKWTASLFGTNLTDELTYVGGVNYRANVGTARYDIGRPREFGISLRREF